ncbi:copper resistance protein B [Guyparkeria hydrothermalis]|uniref:copper resistance protein B n=1 Tax=Guyparkeria hydrothermalis TaxID=923 RepID=UPI002020BD2F|nr:copper resistance protein B [Guyparkeria hydrothermalis]MCL7744386.1 copper resistance protein B [Guyparkeria hydrothermalis]
MSTKPTIRTVLGSLLTAGMLAGTPMAALADGQAPFARDKGWAPPVGDEPYGRFLIDRLEYAAGDDEDSVNWEFQGWYGGDYNRVMVKGEGEDTVSGGSGGEIEKLDLLYSRLISAFWSIQGGVGYQLEYGPGPDHDRGFAVIGLQGLAPYWFEIDTNLRVSDEGDTSMDFEAEYDVQLGQRVVFQPRLATSYAFDKVEEFGVGQGINNVKLGVRLRYEIKREFAPYIGVSWNRKLGDTADMAEAEGEDTSDFRVLAGVRMWF